MNKTLITISKKIRPLTVRLDQIRHKFSTFVERKPLTSFLSLLFLLVAIIVLGNILRRPEVEPKKAVVAKSVEIYQIGSAPKVSLQGQVKKNGVIQINSLTGGVVQNVLVSEGDVVNRGQTLVWLSSNYQGGNTLTLSRQIAQVQNKNINDTYQSQVDLINKQHDLANQNKDNADQLRNIADQSLSDTHALADFNNSIISTLNSNLTVLEIDPVANAALILSTKQMISQFESANLQLNSASRSAQYQSNGNNPPAKLAQTQLDLTNEQLDIQKKALDLNKEVSNLQLQLAKVSEATMYPAAPFSGTVQHVFVRPGQNVNPGTPLFTLSASQNSAAIVYVYTSQGIAQKVSKLEPSLIQVGDQKLSATPSFVSTEAVSGNLYSIVYSLPEEASSSLTDGGFVPVEVPVGYSSSEASVPFIPLDSIYQTQDQASVFVIRNGKAASKTVKLGTIFGQFVQINSGIQNGDQIILDRTVVDGDKVAPKKV